MSGSQLSALSSQQSFGAGGPESREPRAESLLGVKQ